MKKNKILLYKEIDRIIRIVYKEITFNNHMNNSYLFNSNLFSSISDSYNLDNKILQNQIKNKYFLVYPNNYNSDDLDLILEKLINILIRKYNSSNSMYLLFLVSDSIIQQDLNGIYIDFDDLLEWDGLINKIDIKLLTAPYFITHSLNQKQTFLESTLKHNNKRLYEIFGRIGLSENHMHLKASGYGTDINWYGFCINSIFNEELYNKFVMTEGIYSNVDKSDNNVKYMVNNILKFKFIKIMLSAFNQKFVDLNNTSIYFIKQVMISNDVIKTLNENGKTIKFDDIYDKVLDIWINYTDKKDVNQFANFEFTFIIESMKQLVLNKSDYQSFLLFLFNLYISGMTELKFQFIQDNLGMGFFKFKEKENSKSFFIDNRFEEYVIRSVFHKYYSEKHIKKVEFRVAPKDNINDYKKVVWDMDKMNELEYMGIKNKQSISKLKYGIIIHFIKLLKNRNLSYIDDEINKREKMDKDVTVLLEAISIINDSRNEFQGKIVGIDTANYELDNRPTLYSLYYRKVRELSENGQKIFATYHVGEEFSTLSNGIRAIDEVLTFCDFRANDRLGHALALGIDVKDYYEAKRGKFMCSLGDYLDDLVWMYSVLVMEENKENNQYLLFLRHEYSKYIHHLLTDETIPDFDDYLAFYYLRGDDPDLYLKIKDEYDYDYETICNMYTYKINKTNIFHESSFKNRKARNLFKHYSFSDKFRQAFKKPVMFSADIILLNCINKVQQIIRKKVLNMHIYIEANPSSNKKISYIDQYIKLPALSLNRFKLEEDTFKDSEFLNIPISINTDDSSIFQTNLTNEYSLVAAALFREGYNHEQIYNYIESLAIASNTHSFIE